MRITSEIAERYICLSSLIVFVLKIPKQKNRFALEWSDSTPTIDLGQYFQFISFKLKMKTSYYQSKYFGYIRTGSHIKYCWQCKGRNSICSSVWKIKLVFHSTKLYTNWMSFKNDPRDDFSFIICIVRRHNLTTRVAFFLMLKRFDVVMCIRDRNQQQSNFYLSIYRRGTF